VGGGVGGGGGGGGGGVGWGWGGGGGLRDRIQSAESVTKRVSGVCGFSRRTLQRGRDPKQPTVKTRSRVSEVKRKSPKKV